MISNLPSSRDYLCRRLRGSLSIVILPYFLIGICTHSVFLKLGTVLDVNVCILYYESVTECCLCAFINKSFLFIFLLCNSWASISSYICTNMTNPAVVRPDRPRRCLAFLRHTTLVAFRPSKIVVCLIMRRILLKWIEID